jgi:diguanylate cyclase (GGDEF)-like protein
VSPILTSALTAAGGVLAGLAAAGPLLCAQQRALAAARHAAARDPLTGLPNRRALITTLSAALARGQVAVVLLDLDQFKTINDRCGHATGDAVLRTVADRLTTLPVRLAARLSGDEFVLVVAGGLDCGRAAAQMARRLLAAPLPANGRWLHLTASAGVAAGRAGADAAGLLHHADLAMYRAKTSGGGTAVHTEAGQPPPAIRPARRARDRHQPTS